jgi:FkbM family methyltransferase
MTFRSQIHKHLPKRLRLRRWIASELRSGEPELRLVQALLGAVGPLIDVGANRGVYSAVALSLNREAIAFEPVPSEAKALRALIGKRGTVYEVALSDSAGMADLFVPYAGPAEVTTRASLEEGLDLDLEHRRIRVVRKALDSYDFKCIAMLKIDVEGHESAVLRGAVETIRRCQPSILIEVEEARAPGSFAAVSEMLIDLEYEGYWLDGTKLRRLAAFDFEVNQIASLRPRWGDERSTNYINNFVWLPKGKTFDFPPNLLQ